MTSILQVFYSIFSGLMLAAAIPNEIYSFGCPVISFVALIPFYIAIRYYCKSYKQAFLLGFIQTITTHLASSFWLAYFKDFAIFTLGGSALYTGALGACVGFFFYLPYSRKTREELNEYKIQKPFYEHTSFRVLFFCFMYTLYEWLKSSGFIGYPWGTVSSSMYNFPVFMQLASITGTYGITFLTVFFNCLVAEAVILYIKAQKTTNKDNLFFELKNCSYVFGILFLLTMLYGYYQMNLQRTPIKTLTTVMVQQNSDPWKQTTDDESILLSQQLTDKAIEKLKKDDKKPQLIVWSEGVIQKPMPDSYGRYKKHPAEESLVNFLKRIDTPLVAGGSFIEYYDDKDLMKFYNSAHLFDRDGTYRGHYAKLHLVPFAESIPGIDNPKIKAIMMKIVGISAGWSKGKQLTYFDIPCSWYDESTKYEPVIDIVDISIPSKTQNEFNKNKPTVRISTPICFDDSFSDVMRPLFLNGSELFVNITDDSWSLKNSSEIQHFVIASYRTIEYRTTMLRSANAGYSVVIDPTGRIIADEPLFKEYSIGVDVPVYERRLTVYARYGNWLPYLCVIILFLTSFFMLETFTESDYIPSERKIKNKKKKHSKKK